LRTVPKFKMRREATLEKTVLADGTDAWLLSAEFDRLDNRRLSFYSILYCRSAQGERIDVTGFLTCAPASGTFIKVSGVVEFLKSHVTSLVLDPAKLDMDKLKQAYARYNWGLNAAIGKLWKATATSNRRTLAWPSKRIRKP